MTRVLAVLLVVLAAAGCGVRPSGVIPGLEAPAGPAEQTVPTLYFVAAGKVVPVRSMAPGQPRANVVDLLAAGPDLSWRRKGMTTQVPPDAGPAMVKQVDRSLDVRLRSDPTMMSTLALDQIVCTLLAQYPNATSAALRGGGHTVDRRTCPVGR